MTSYRQIGNTSPLTSYDVVRAGKRLSLGLDQRNNGRLVVVHGQCPSCGVYLSSNLLFFLIVLIGKSVLCKISLRMNRQIVTKIHTKSERASFFKMVSYWGF